MEGRHYVSTGILETLSEQQVIDCSAAYGNRGCNGGRMDWSIRYSNAYPLNKASDYQYVGSTQTCGDTSKGFVKATGMTYVSQTSTALKAAVKTGPVSVSIQAN